MNTVLIAIALLVAIALCGWAIAELKGKHDVYKHSEEELAAEKRAADLIKTNGFNESDIHDVIATISTKGFQA